MERGAVRAVRPVTGTVSNGIAECGRLWSTGGGRMARPVRRPAENNQTLFTMCSY